MNEQIDKRELAGNAVMNLLQGIAERSCKVSSSVEDRLNSITRPKSEAPMAGEKTEVENYPPLLNDIRKGLWIIQASLDSIEDTVSRLEI